MDRIHEQVAGGHGRVELTRPGCDDVCVILSKAELESLERALEILSETSEYKAMKVRQSHQPCHRMRRKCGPATDLAQPMKSERGSLCDRAPGLN